MVPALLGTAVGCWDLQCSLVVAALMCSQEKGPCSQEDAREGTILSPYTHNPNASSQQHQTLPGLAEHWVNL